MNLTDITTWSVSKGVATPKNPYKHQIGKSRDFTVKISEQELYSEFKVLAQQHTYATNAPDGIYSRFGQAELQIRIKHGDTTWGNWKTVTEKECNRFGRRLTLEKRQFLPFIDQVKAESPKFGEWISVKQVLQDALDYLHKNVTASIVYEDFHDFSKGIKGAEVDYFPESADELLIEMGILPSPPKTL